MKVQSFENMRAIYREINDLKSVDRSERNELLKQFKYSVIIEGSHIEFDNLNTWLKQNVSEHPLKEIFYGKIDYDYGFAEFFVNEKIEEEKLKFAAKNIYTTWANATISKSDGSWISDVPYSPDDKDAIVYPYDENS
jgi:hypothetical protein